MVRALAALVLMAGVFLMGGSVGATIVDRIAITVGNRVITDSEIENRLRLTAFQNGVAAVLSGEARREAAQRLIDQKIVEREMDVGHFPRSSDARRKELAAAFANERYKGDRAAMGVALEAAGLTERDLEDDFARQADLLTFLSLRFRPAGLLTGKDDSADSDLEAWLRDQRTRLRIAWLEPELCAAGAACVAEEVAR